VGSKVKRFPVVVLMRLIKSPSYAERMQAMEKLPAKGSTGRLVVVSGHVEGEGVLRWIVAVGEFEHLVALVVDLLTCRRQGVARK